MPRILVVDDNPELLALLSSAFEEAGYTVQTAQRGRAALDLAKKDKPDFAVIDVLLPDLMGFEVGEALQRQKIPVAFMSGVHKGGKAAANATFKYGAVGYFEKPFERKALLELATRLVPVRPSAQAQAWDVEGETGIEGPSEPMELTGIIELTSGGTTASIKGAPLRLRGDTSPARPPEPAPPAPPPARPPSYTSLPAVPPAGPAANPRPASSPSPPAPPLRPPAYESATYVQMNSLPPTPRGALTPPAPPPPPDDDFEIDLSSSPGKPKPVALPKPGPMSVPPATTWTQAITNPNLSPVASPSMAPPPMSPQTMSQSPVPRHVATPPPAAQPSIPPRAEVAAPPREPIALAPPAPSAPPPAAPKSETPPAPARPEVTLPPRPLSEGLRAALTAFPPAPGARPHTTPVPPIESLVGSPERGSIHRGKIDDNLPQLFAAFLAAQETGELGVSRGQVKKIVYFEKGMPVFALSNLVAERLGQFLVRAGKIDEATLKAALREANGTSQRTGDVLIQMGLITEQERLYYVGQQIKSILYSLFAWTDGNYQLSFQDRARKERIKLDIHPATLVLRGVKKLYKLERMQRILAYEDRPMPGADPLFSLSDVELQGWEALMIAHCDGTRRVAELVLQTGKAEIEALGTLVALVSMRILEKRR